MYSFSRKQMQAVDRAGGAVRGDRCVPWVRRMASAGVVAIGAVLLPALPAGAVVVHATTSSPTATHGVGHATGRGVGPALTGSQFNVTDLATNVTTTFQSSTVGVESGCGNSATFFCLGLGNGNAVSVTTVAPMASGQLLTAPDGGNAVTVTVEGRTCGEFQPQGGSYTAGVEVDQFDPSTRRPCRPSACKSRVRTTASPWPATSPSTSRTRPPDRATTSTTGTGTPSPSATTRI